MARLKAVEELLRRSAAIVDQQEATIAAQAALLAAQSAALAAQATEIAGLSHSGTAVLDFGAVPASTAEVTVTGQDGISLSTRVRAWISADRHMSDNNENSHLMAGFFLKLVTGGVVADESFDISAVAMVGLVTGRFRVDYLWSA